MLRKWHRNIYRKKAYEKGFHLWSSYDINAKFWKVNKKLEIPILLLPFYMECISKPFFTYFIIHSTLYSHSLIKTNSSKLLFTFSFPKIFPPQTLLPKLKLKHSNFVHYYYRFHQVSPHTLHMKSPVFSAHCVFVSVFSISSISFKLYLFSPFSPLFFTISLYFGLTICIYDIFFFLVWRCCSGFCWHCFFVVGVNVGKSRNKFCNKFL